MKNCNALNWIIKKAPITSEYIEEEVNALYRSQFFHGKLPYKMILEIERFFGVRSICHAKKDLVYNGLRFIFTNENTFKGGVNKYRINIDNEPALIEILNTKQNAA